MRKNLTWQKRDYDVSDFRDGLMLALVHSGVCVTLQNADGDYLFVSNLPEPWVFTSDETPTDRDIYGDIIGEELAALKTKAVNEAEMQTKEFALPDKGHFEFIIDPVANDKGELQILTTIVDRSEERHRERVLKTLLREVSHRSKNLLAIVLSLASQTARGETNIDRFLRIFRGRVFSVSASQDIVTDMSWQGARFQELLQSQVDKYLPDEAGRVTFEGDNPVLSPNAAMHVGLSLHELVVNLVSRDAESDAVARAKVTCAMDSDNQIEIYWKEHLSDHADDVQQRKNGFSESMLNRIVPASVGGEAELALEDNAINYRLKFPQQ